ncbi:MAG: ribosome-binding factor A [Flavobacteriales bacterium]|nr:ribosome-binding factor A [Flavobacteriales bacterium]
MESTRQQKINRVIEEELAEVFRKQASESGMKGVLVTVSAVRVTPDLSIAKVYISIFPKENRGKIYEEIKENTAVYRKYIGNKLGKILRVIPSLNFFLDTNLDDVEIIEKELKGLGNNPKL